jgi:pimeloyl-ACP methyl ester carboxylesterase
MLRHEPTMTTGDLARIPMPALVLVGDDDAVLSAHTWSLYESLPAGQLAVIPGASHIVPYEKPELVARLVADLMRTRGEVRP